MKNSKSYSSSTSKPIEQGHSPRSQNKQTKAAALKYDGQNSPTLLAKGEGEIAKEIISIAQGNKVHIHYDPLLLEVLSRLEMGEEIPEALYLAVAKIIAFAYFLQGKHPDKKPSKEMPPNLTLSNHSPQNSSQDKTLRTNDDFSRLTRNDRI